jgi:hypothetical protein
MQDREEKIHDKADDPDFDLPADCQSEGICRRLA